MYSMFIAYYLSPRFNRRRAHHQGDLQEY